MTIGTIVHPKATIFAIAGPIVIGSGCIIEESAIIVNRYVVFVRIFPFVTFDDCAQTKRSHAHRGR